MQLRAVVRRDDVIGLLEEITPLRVELSRRPQRAVSIGRPTELDFVPGTGLRIRTSARITWDVAGLAVPVTARTIQLLLTPKLDQLEGGFVLSLEPKLEDFDLEAVPFFIDNKIASAVNDGIERQRSKLTWNLTRLLGFDLPEKVSPPMRIDLGITDASVEVEAEALVIDVSLRPRGVGLQRRLRAVGDHAK